MAEESTVAVVRPQAPVRRREIADQTTVRAHNLAAVAQLVRTDGPRSRRDIGASLGLNKATVSGLVAELIKRGLLEEGDQQAWGGPGRPTRLVQIGTTTHSGVVVEILTQHVILSAWTLALTPITRHALDFAPHLKSPEAHLTDLRDALERLVGNLRSAGRRVDGIVVALPGLVDASTGELVRSAPLQWHDVPIRTILRQSPTLQHIPVLVERVDNLATLAEFHAHPGSADLICLHGGEAGIGAGVIAGGKLLTGAHGRAGELLFPTLRRSTHTDPDLRELLRRVTSKDPASTEEQSATLTQLARHLGLRLATLIALFDPEFVVLAGSLAPHTDQLADQLHNQLRAAWEPDPSPAVNLRPGTYGEDAALIGGATQLADNVLTTLREERGNDPQ